MSDAGLKALLQLEKTMVVSHLAKRSIVAYSREVRFMIEHYPDMDPMDWTEDLVIDYIHHLITEKQASRSKCHMAAQSMAYFSTPLPRICSIAASTFTPSSNCWGTAKSKQRWCICTCNRANATPW